MYFDFEGSFGLYRDRNVVVDALSYMNDLCDFSWS